MRSKGARLLEERTFADVSDQFDPPDFAIFDEIAAPTVATPDDELCCARCTVLSSS